MAEQILKLTPDRDLECFFLHPSAIAALSGTSETGFTVSGTWRQQFDWAVVDWNCNNTYEHPTLRYLPDGDLSGLVLTYEETRTNCIPLDSELFPTVDWPYLRIWAGDDPAADPYYIALADHKTAIAGSYGPASADFTLSGTVAAGDYIGLSYLGASYTYQAVAGDTVDTVIQAITNGMNGPTSLILTATCSGATIHVIYPSTSGANGNRFGVYSTSSGAATWDARYKTLSGGTSPTTWQISIDFSTLVDKTGETVPTNKIRKMRWTYAADLQAGAFERSEFSVVVSNWTVTGSGRTYSVAGPGSARIEDNDPRAVYANVTGGGWSQDRGNYSGGTIQWTQTAGDSVTCTYDALQSHTLYLGSRYLDQGAKITIAVDGTVASSPNLWIAQEDTLFRSLVGTYAAGSHTVTITHAGIGNPAGTVGLFYFDFLELVVPTNDLPYFPDEPRLTLATDWDTDHSLALAPERTAWMIQKLGFKGRQNHYVGALWFYELVNPANAYAVATVTFTGSPDPGYFVSLFLGRDDDPPGTAPLEVQRGMHPGDTLDTIALSYAIEFNNGYTALWASASGNVLTLYSRSMGTDGNHLTVTGSTTGSDLTPTAVTFAGGNTGNWFTDLAVTPRLNRAARDWTTSFLTALHGYGIDGAASFSMELQNVDPSTTAGMVQRGPSGDAILLPTPSYQTNFSPTSLNFWKQVYADMAAIQAAAGLTPYLQFGEVQWWYFPNDGLGHAYSGMPFYDAYSTSQFLATYGRAMTVFTDNTADPTSYPEEASFLPGLIGTFTDAIMSYVRTTQPSARFEVLYPLDVNQTAFNKVMNYPAGSWTPSALTCLKTEAFGFTLGRNLDRAETAITYPATRGFGAGQSSHLVGVSDPTTPWLKEVRSAQGKGFESVVLFALDQFCLVGLTVPLPASFRRSERMGS